jgi:hypothetical protein
VFAAAEYSHTTCSCLICFFIAHFVPCFISEGYPSIGHRFLASPVYWLCNKISTHIRNFHTT